MSKSSCIVVYLRPDQFLNHLTVIENTIRDGGSIALNAAYTVDTVDMVYTVKMVYNVDSYYNGWDACIIPLDCHEYREDFKPLLSLLVL